MPFSRRKYTLFRNSKAQVKFENQGVAGDLEGNDSSGGELEGGMDNEIEIEIKIENGQGKLESRFPQPLAPRDKLDGPADIIITCIVFNKNSKACDVSHTWSLFYQDSCSHSRYSRG